MFLVLILLCDASWIGSRGFDVFALWNSTTDIDISILGRLSDTGDRSD